MDSAAQRVYSGQQAPQEFVYDPNNLDPIDQEARLHDDTSGGIDWDEIIAETEPDWRAGRYTVYRNWEDFQRDFRKIGNQILEDIRAERATS